MSVLHFTVLVAPVAAATSTAREIAASAKIDREIAVEQGSISDPLLNAWVKRIAMRLWQHVHRSDVPYTAKILDSSEVNAFTTGGGFIYLDEGVLDTVGSDDELAGIIGHETGHDEHRHPITLRQRGEVLSVVFGLAALFSPALAALGQFAGEGVMAKASRTDEFQADAEGLNLLNKANFDPQAMVSLMRRLQSLAGDADTHIDKYLADHPGLPDRIARLQKTAPILTENKSTSGLRQAAVQAANSQRFAVAQTRFARYTQLVPDDYAALEEFAQLNAILGQPARALQGAQTVSAGGNGETGAAAAAEVRVLQAEQRARANLPLPKLAPLRAELVATRTEQQRLAAESTPTREDARATLAAVQSRIERLEGIAPQLDDQGSADDLSHELAKLGRTVNLVLDHSATIIDGVGTLAPGKEAGLWAESAEITRELALPLTNNDVPADSRTLLPWYPEFNASVRAADVDINSATHDAYTALLRLDRGLDALEALFRAVGAHERDNGGAAGLAAFSGALTQAQSALAPALIQSTRALQAYNRCRSRQLEVRLGELNLGASRAGVTSLNAALNAQLEPTPPIAVGYSFASGVSVGEYTAARILAADLQTSATALLAQAKLTHRSVLDLPETAKADTQALEIFLGLIYVDYTDDAAKAEFTKVGTVH